jgi:hypothetical protein
MTAEVKVFYYFCLMMGGSWRPKNLRIRIRNAVICIQIHSVVEAFIALVT